MIDSNREKELNDRLSAIHKRVQWMADEEARSAWLHGFEAQGNYFQDKVKLVEEAERILDELKAPPDIQGT